MKAQHRFALDIRQEGAPPKAPGSTPLSDAEDD